MRALALAFGSSALCAVALACAPSSEGPEQPIAPVGEEGEWQSRADLSVGPRQEVGVAALGGEIYVVGGFDDRGNIVRDVLVYAPESDDWREAAPLPFPLHHANLAAADDKLVVAGSLIGPSFDANGRVLLYDPAADEWSEGLPMPTGSERGGAAVTVLDDHVYVIGGLRAGSAVREVSRYDVKAHAWESLPSLPEPRDHVVAGVIDGLIYVAGGRERSIASHRPTLFIYDPATKTWSEGAPLPTSRAGAAAAVSDGRLYVFGGEGYADDESGVFPHTEAYDPARDSWTLLAPMRTPRHGLGAATIDGVIYLPGGGVRQSFAATSVHEAFRPPREGAEGLGD